MATQTSTTNASPVSGPEGHDAAMTAKADAALAPKPNEQPAPAPAERPAGLPEKFSSWEDMASAYAELERKQSGGKPEGTPATTPETPEAAQAQVEAAGLDFAVLTSEYQTAGELSQATYDKLAAAGIPKDTVDSYIAGQEAIAQQAIDGVMGEFGGAEQYGQMVQWASANMSKADVTAFNKVMDGGDLGSIKLTIAGLQAKYLAANGSEPTLLNGGNSPTDADVFRSTAELTAAMRDTRYAKDPAYRADVQAKAGRSSIF